MENPLGEPRHLDHGDYQGPVDAIIGFGPLLQLPYGLFFFLL